MSYTLFVFSHQLKCSLHLDMKKKKIEIQYENEDDFVELTAEQIHELKHSLKDSKDPVRYVVYRDILSSRKWIHWLNVSYDGYGNSIDQATLFKREHIARAVAKAYSEGGKNDLLIAKITTKGGRRRVLRYEKPKNDQILEQILESCKE